MEPTEDSALDEELLFNIPGRQSGNEPPSLEDESLIDDEEVKSSD